jgi:phytoene dehydrogenase-like protein
MSGKPTSTKRGALRSPTRRDFLIGTAGFLFVAVFPWRHLLHELRFTAIPISEHSPNSTLGHFLRDGHFPSGVETSSGGIEKIPVVIVGGGIAGLSAAWWLSRNGVSDYVLLELEERTGGNSSSGENSTSAFPWGAHYLPIPNVESVWVHTFLEEVGIITGKDSKGRPIFDESAVCHDDVERLWIEGRFQEGILPRNGLSEAERAEIRSFFDDMRAFSALNGKDKRPIFTIPIAEGSKERFTAKAVEGLDRISMADWLDRRGYHSKPLRWYMNYACRDDFGSRSETTSAWAGIHYHAARRGVAANAESSAILTWPEGNGYLAEKLRGLATGKIRTGEIALELTPMPDGDTLVTTSRGKTGEHRRILAKSVVIAAPRFVANRIVPEAGRIAIDGNGIGETAHYVPWMVANLSVRDLPETTAEGRAGLTAWDNVSYYSDSLGYVVATHQTDTIARGSVLTHYWPLTDLAPREARIAAAKVTPYEWRERILNDLERMHPEIRSIVERIDFRIWGHGMISPVPGYLSGKTRAALEKSYGRIHFAHSDISGMSLFEEAQYRGVLAAKKVLADLGQTEHRGRV